MQINDLLQLTTEQNASDLILVAGTNPTLRVNSRLMKTGMEVLTPETVEKLVYSFLTEEQKKSFEKERELDLAYELGESRFRINVHYERQRVAATIRRIPRKVPTLGELSLPKRVGDFCNENDGLILVTGPTGSGKSTTQAAMIDKINKEEALHIITIEDPIEYIYSNDKSVIEQREVGSDTFSFARALKRVLRQDPDVIQVGEMRDLDTIQTALTAAETGHIVISTLHTPDAPQAVDRIVDVFPPYQQAQIRLQLSLTLKGVIAQRLLPRKDKPGVVVAIEILVVNPAVRNLIRKGQTQEIYSIMEISSKLGMQSMNVSLKEHYERGFIDYDTALGCSPDPENFEKVLKVKEGKATNGGGVKFM